MKRLSLTALAVTTALSTLALSATTAQAALYLLNGSTAVTPLKMGPGQTFASLYDLQPHLSGLLAGFSANSGYEQTNTMVSFLAEEDDGDLGLFVIFDKKSFPNNNFFNAFGSTGGGSARVDLVNIAGLSSIAMGYLVKDDITAIFSPNSGGSTGPWHSTHLWNGYNTDGFVFGTLPNSNGAGWTLGVNSGLPLTNTANTSPLGIDRYRYLSFNNGAGAPTSLRVSSDFTLQRVPEPATLALFGLGTLGLGLVRRRRPTA